MAMLEPLGIEKGKPFAPDARQKRILEEGALLGPYDKITLNADCSADLYLGPNAPAGSESNWIDTSASKGWFVWFRFFGPRQPAFDGSWQLADIERVN